MIRKKTIIVGISVITLLIVTAIASSGLGGKPVTYRTARIEKGDITSHISASGKIYPLKSIEVGAQVSGVVRDIYVDFNSPVKKGQILAQINPSFYEFLVDEAKASLQKVQIDANNKRKLFELYKSLINKPDRISKYDLDNSKVDYTSTLTQVKIAKINLAKAEANLYSTTIKSPIDGVIYSRDLEVGEVVAVASDRSRPLFVIAKDLTKMEVEADVSEADIGRVRLGQSAYFTTDAYPDQNFKSEVLQVRNHPTTYQNVVSYKIVLPVDNKELKLKPGMTAYVNVVVDSNRNILRVPNAALSYANPSDMGLETSEQSSVGELGRGTIWVLSDKKKPKQVSIKLGKRNSNFTEIVGSGINEGDIVVVEAIRKEDSPFSSIISPQMNY